MAGGSKRKCIGCDQKREIAAFYGTSTRCKDCTRVQAQTRAVERRAAGLCIKCPKTATHGYHCERCRKTHLRTTAAYAKKTPEQQAAYGAAWRKKVKIATFNAYGGAVCSCCKEKHLEFLTIDHIAGGGTVHRRELAAKGFGWGNSMYRWLKAEGYPSGYRVLCMNCNFAHGKFGYCPHKKGAAHGRR